MKIYPDVLNEKLYGELVSFFESNPPEVRYFSNQYNWNDSLLQGMIGTCLCVDVNDYVKSLILEDINHLLPKYDKIEMLFYRWGKQSGINWHTDAPVLFGGTIYLNRQWSKRDGGILLWEEESEIRGYSPEANTLVLNTENQNHMVTPIHYDASQPRYTIQLFGTCSN